MAILRCNKCFHVAEVAGELVGKTVACPACGNEVPAYDTVLFVKKVLQQYFAQRDELQQLRAARPDAALAMNPASASQGRAIDTMSAAPVASSPSATSGVLIRFEVITGIPTSGRS